MYYKARAPPEECGAFYLIKSRLVSSCGTSLGINWIGSTTKSVIQEKGDSGSSNVNDLSMQRRSIGGTAETLKNKNLWVRIGGFILCLQ
jgi:hypothetical protein